jgi:hypothetical protein
LLGLLSELLLDLLASLVIHMSVWKVDKAVPLVNSQFGVLLSLLSLEVRIVPVIRLGLNETISSLDNADWLSGEGLIDLDIGAIELDLLHVGWIVDLSVLSVDESIPLVNRKLLLGHFFGLLLLEGSVIVVRGLELMDFGFGVSKLHGVLITEQGKNCE